MYIHIPYTRLITIGNFNGSFVLELNVKLSQAAIDNGGRITSNPAFPRVTYPVGLDELPDDFFPLPFPTNVQASTGRSGGRSAKGGDQRLGGVRGQLRTGHDRAAEEEVTCLLIFFYLPLFFPVLAQKKKEILKEINFFFFFFLAAFFFFEKEKIYLQFFFEGNRY